jgi:hypothetical protein
MWEHRNDAFDLLAVSGDNNASQETVGNLCAGKMIERDFSQTGRVREPFPGGFGQAVGTGAIRQFLESKSVPQN